MKKHRSSRPSHQALPYFAYLEKHIQRHSNHALLGKKLAVKNLINFNSKQVPARSGTLLVIHYIIPTISYFTHIIEMFALKTMLIKINTNFGSDI